MLIVPGVVWTRRRKAWSQTVPIVPVCPQGTAYVHTDLSTDLSPFARRSSVSIHPGGGVVKTYRFGGQLVIEAINLFLFVICNIVLYIARGNRSNILRQKCHRWVKTKKLSPPPLNNYVCSSFNKGVKNYHVFICVLLLQSWILPWLYLCGFHLRSKDYVFLPLWLSAQS